MFSVHVLMYATETMIWKEAERSRIRALQIRALKMDNLRRLLDIWRMEREPEFTVKGFVHSDDGGGRND